MSMDDRLRLSVDNAWTSGFAVLADRYATCPPADHRFTHTHRRDLTTPPALTAARCWGLGNNGTVNRLKRSEVSPSGFAEFEGSSYGSGPKRACPHVAVSVGDPRGLQRLMPLRWLRMHIPEHEKPLFRRM